MKRIITFFVCTVLAITVFAQEEQACKVTPEQLTPGTTVTIIYNPAKGNLKNGNDIRGVYYCWKDYHWEAYDMDLSKVGANLQTTFSLPDGTALLAWKFCDRTSTDVGGDEWLYAQFVNRDGKSMPSANIGWAMLRGANTQELGGIPTVRDLKFRRIGNDVVRYWINTELRDHPDQLPDVAWFATQVLSTDSATNNSEVFKQNLQRVLNMDKQTPLTEIQLLRGYQVASSILRDAELCHEFEQRLISRYPDGQLVREKATIELHCNAQKENFEELLMDYLQKYPAEKYKNAFQTQFMFQKAYSEIFRIYVYTAAMKKDYSRLNKTYKMAPTTNLWMYFWHLIQIPYDRKDLTGGELFERAKMLRDEVMSRPREGQEQAYSPAEWKEMMYSQHLDPQFVYAQILNDLGMTSEAMALTDTRARYYGAKDADFSTFRIAMLNKCGRATEILPIVKEGLRQNAASPEMLAWLEKEYNNDAGLKKQYNTFADYSNSLKSGDHLEALKERVLSKLFDTPVKLFSIEKMQGGQLDMNSLKGKIIVIDFWATWCGPCKAAMPGMQMAVNKYKGDKGVQFLFVATMETDKNYKEKIKSFISEKGYDFQVCYDGIAANGKNEKLYSAYAAQFHSSGIPMKMIIDGNGHARWLSNGYFGSPTALVDELSFVIDYLKNEK